MTFQEYAESKNIALLPWQLEAANALLAVMHTYRHGNAGKTFLMNGLNAFIEDHGNEFEIDSQVG